MIDCLFFIFLFRVRFFIHGQTVDAHQHRITLVEHTKLNNDFCRPHYTDHRVEAFLYNERAYYKGQCFLFSLGALQHS